MGKLEFEAAKDSDTDWLEPYRTPKTHIKVGEGPWQAYEKSVFETVGDTFRGLRHPDVTNLIKPSDLTGKVVLDLGSGLGGLVKSASVEGIDTTIISVNPALRSSARKASEEELGREALKAGYPGITDEQIKKAQQVHDANLSTSFAHDMADIPNNGVDILVDNAAVHAFMPDDKSFYENTLDEMLRVTKDKIIVGDGGRNSLWEERGIPKTVLDEKKIPYELVHKKNPDGSKRVSGVIIYKKL